MLRAWLSHLFFGRERDDEDFDNEDPSPARASDSDTDSDHSIGARMPGSRAAVRNELRRLDERIGECDAQLARGEAAVATVDEQSLRLREGVEALLMESFDVDIEGSASCSPNTPEAWAARDALEGQISYLLANLIRRREELSNRAYELRIQLHILRTQRRYAAVAAACDEVTEMADLAPLSGYATVHGAEPSAGPADSSTRSPRHEYHTHGRVLTSTGCVGVAREEREEEVLVPDPVALTFQEEMLDDTEPYTA